PMRKAGCKPAIEMLEDRALPSTYTVTSLANSGPGTLRDALTQVMNDGRANDTININVTGVINVNNSGFDFDMATLNGKNLSINGPGAGILTVQSDPSIAPIGTAPEQGFIWINGGALTISGLTIKHFGYFDDSGGLAANTGTVTLNNVVVTDC